MARSGLLKVIAVLAISILLAARTAQALPPAPAADFELQTEQSIKDLSVSIFASHDPHRMDQNKNGLLRIQRGKGKIFELAGGMFSLYPIGEKLSPSAAEKFTVDLNKNGIADLVVLEQTNGIGCCLNLHFVELGKTVTLIGRVLNGYATDPDIRGSAAGFSVYTKDLTFGGWGTKDLSEPAPEIVLRVAPNGLRLDWEQMSRAPFDEQNFSLQSKQALGDLTKQPINHVDRDLPRTLIEPILTLIYTGNAEQALRFIDAAWPDSRPGKARFREALFRQLAASPYWQELKLKVPATVRKETHEAPKPPIKH